MKTLKIISWLLFSLLLFIACENEGDKIYLSSKGDHKLIASNDRLVLSPDITGQIVLSLAWTDNTLQVSNSTMSVPDILTTSLQASTLQDFSSNRVESVEADLSKAYMGAELNTLGNNLGLNPDISTPVYFRLKYEIGSNLEPVYSNVVEVIITTYFIDMSVGFILDENKEATGITLSSTGSNGIYSGFMGATGWYNFYILEGDGTIWGNDRIIGTPFLLSSASDSWNCWFPGVSGCYYIVVDVNNRVWSALLLPTLTVSGDVNAEMTFDRLNLRWTTVFEAASASKMRIKLNTIAQQYDYATGTENAEAIATPVAFASREDGIVLASEAGDFELNVPDAGEYTLIVDLSDPNAWIYTLISGSEETEEISPFVYLPGIDDLTSGSWTFDNYLELYDEDNLNYAGIVDVNSEWGYSINPEKDNWENKYTFGAGDAYSGSLIYQGGENVPAPPAGTYLIDVSLKNLTYSHTELQNYIYLMGLHDQWEFDILLEFTSISGVYSGMFTINSASTWGFHIYLFNGEWDRYYGGSDGELHYLGNNILDDSSLEPGTYHMTVDLINQTYSITK